ncbi:MAG TPA: propionyl-CoA synthetase [Dehalococcoidia bacterium]|nr:propionyl-CoA synthetase [Dehalococcoidia bacterium]
MPGNYREVYEQSISSPEEFWATAAEEIYWYKKYTTVLDDSNKPFYRWFDDGELNTCYNALDYHVENGCTEKTAVIYDSPVTGSVRKITYGELLKQVSKLAGALSNKGIVKGDRIIIYMPMIPEAVVTMLACARIGAIHSVVFGGFSPDELAVRIEDAQPKVIISASCGIEGEKTIEYHTFLNRAIELSHHKPECCIVFQREVLKANLMPDRDYDWDEVMKDAKPVGCIPVKSTDPLYILYTSGTTGKPKGVVRDNGGHAVVLKWSMKYIYGLEPGDVFWAASDIGWVVGHSYIVYGPLLHGCTTVLYEGKPVGTPDPGAFWRVVSQHQVKVFFTAPTAIRAIKREDTAGDYLKKYDVLCLKYLFLAGERLDPNTYHWISELLDIPVIDNWWQTETGWPIAANFPGIELLPIKAGSPTKSVPGYKVEILDENGKSLNSDEQGNIVIKLPLPPGTLVTLWQDDEKFKESYTDRFPGYYNTGDGGYIDGDGYIYVMGRVDDVINVAGHRLSTGAMEAVIANHPDVAECAVIGVADELKGQLPLGLVVLKSDIDNCHETIINDLIAMVRERIGAIASFKQVLIVNALPKTRSGKVLRGVMRSIADGQEYQVPSTVEDKTVLTDIENILKGYMAGRKENSKF